MKKHGRAALEPREREAARLACLRGPRERKGKDAAALLALGWSWLLRPKSREKKNRTSFLFSQHNFKSNLNSNSNSFVNSNQTKASQHKYAAAWMHTHVCRPIFDFIFNQVIIFLNLNAHKIHN